MVRKIKKILSSAQQKIAVIVILCFSCIIYSCSFLTTKNATTSDTKEVVTIYDYQIWLSNLDRIELRDSTVYYIDTLTLCNRKNWVFTSNDSIFYDNSYVFLSFLFSYAIEKDSLFLNNLYCPNLDTIHLKYEDKMVELIISYYEEEKTCDGEEYVYWNHDYGLVALFNYSWGALNLIDREAKKGFAKEIFYNDFINRAKEKRKLRLEELGLSEDDL
jgi:hypothetical protein